MARPQLEDGHTQIANEILEQLAKFYLSPNQWQVVIFVIRKTYGFKKKVDYIANSQIVEGTGLSKSVVSRVLKRLQGRNIITRHKKQIGFQKDWEKWGLAKQSTELAEQPTNKSCLNSQPELAKQSTELAEQPTKVSSPRVAQKKKETIQKKLIQKKEVVLPEWIVKETWDDFLEMRKDKKSTPTPRAQELIIKELEKFRAAGDNPNEVLNQSIMNGWKGVFPLKEAKSGTNRQSSRRLTPRESYTRPEDA